MSVSCNRLWKLPVDKHMTKTDMQKMAGISTSMLAKMDKDEPVSMGTLARIVATMECGLDDIVEVNTDIEKGGKE